MLVAALRARMARVMSASWRWYSSMTVRASGSTKYVSSQSPSVCCVDKRAATLLSQYGVSI